MWEFLHRLSDRSTLRGTANSHGSVQKTTQGMTWKKFTATDVESALALARALQAAGEYQFFRGQENSAWQALPSFLRISDDVEQRTAQIRVARLLSYIRAATQSQSIEYSDDALIAIGQHYGLPTTFLDLTSDPSVAASFACPPGSNYANCPACLLLYSESLIQTWAECAQSSTGFDAIELIRIDVANLWRLEAQSGLFLHIQAPNLYEYFAPDMIEFPHPKGGFISQECVLYPEEKSELELQIDLLFDLEGAEEAKKTILEIIPATVHHPLPVSVVTPNTTPRINVVASLDNESWIRDEVALHDRLRSNTLPIENEPLRTLPKNYYDPAWRYKNGLLWPHPTWFGQRAQQWLVTSVQDWSDVRAPDGFPARVNLEDFDAQAGTDDGLAGAQVSFKPADGDRQRSRHFLVSHRPWREWNGSDVDGEPTAIEERFSSISNYLWDGIRSKPLDDEMVGACMGCFFEHARRFLDLAVEERDHAHNEQLGRRNRDYIRVEFAAIGGHSQTCNVPCSELAAAVRDDLNELVALPEEFTELSKNFGFAHLTQMLYPQYLFDFEKFTLLYYHCILPYQAFIGAITWRSNLGLCFNVRHIKIFGMA